MQFEVFSLKSLEIPTAPGENPVPVSAPSALKSFRVFAVKNRRAFTLMEMLVALSILIIMMGAIGEIFRIAGNASASGQAMLNVMASVRVAQGQMAQDIGGLNTSGYLAIRQRWFIPVWQQNYQYQVGDEVVNTSSILSSEKNALPSFTFYVCLQPNSAASLNTNNATLWQSYTIATGVSSPANSGATSIAWRADQVAFLANGNFQSRTGDNTEDIYNYLTSNAAAIWYGQLCVSYGATAASPYYEFAQNSVPPLNSTNYYAPTGNDAGEFMLGREAILLAPHADYYDVYYYSNITDSSTASANPEGTTAYITSSRVDAANFTPDQIMAAIGDPAPPSAIPDDSYCYRFSAVRTPAASEIGWTAGTPPTPPSTTTKINLNLNNGYFRMMPILLQGVPSFAVDWTDGSTTGGQLNWYGIDNTSTSPSFKANVEPAVDNDDNAMYAFYPGNKFSGTTLQWPLALRFTYTITDPANRLGGGRIISQIIYLSH